MESSGDFKEQLHILAQSLVEHFSEQDAEHSQELLSTFVSELFLCATERNQRLASAGGPRKPLPEKFPEACRAWRSKKRSLDAAAAFCGMPRTSFYDAAKRVAQSAE